MDFKNVPKKYRPIPFWSWNEKLDTKETVEQIHKMNDVGIGGFFMHARGGLETEYMGEEWFENVTASAEAAEELGMGAWAYDENGWPSGFGNGLVNGLGIEYQQKYLRMSDTEPKENVICKSGEHWFYFDVNPFYVDVLDKKVIKRFIDVAYKPYYEKYGDKIEGFFTDEPQISRCGIPWSFVFKEEYAAKYGEDLYEHLEELILPIGDYKATRVNFWKMVTDLFSEAFMKQIYNQCSEWGLKLTGHLVLEETLLSQLTANGSCMPHYEYMHIPGMDWLGRNIFDCLTPLQLSSAAEQLGKDLVLSETFALCGHNVSFAELKGIYEWQMVHGINLLCQHLEGYSIRGIRKRDYPPAMYCQQPWWSEYKGFVDAMSREGMILSKGEKAADVLLMHPQTTAWTLYDEELGPEITNRLKPGIKRAIDDLNNRFLGVIKTLEQKHITFHLGDETLMERHARVENGKLIIGKQSYTHVITSCCEVMLPFTEKLLSEFVKTGGKIVTAEELPANNIIDNCEITYTKRGYDGFTVHYFVNTSPDRKSAKFTVGGKKLDIYTGEISEFNGLHEFEPWGSLMIIDDGCAASEETAKNPTFIRPEGEFTFSAPVQNTLTLDYCDYYFDGELQEKNGYVLNICERANALARPVKIHQDYHIKINSVPKTLLVACETPEIFEISVNGEKIDKTVCGYFRDKSFKTIDIAKYVKEGENTISFDCDFVQSEEFYENLKKARVFESEKNKLVYDMEIEAIYLIGDFAVKTDGKWTQLDKNAFRYCGGFEIDAPKKSVNIKNIEQQGYPFFCGEMCIEGELDICGETPVLELDIKGINAIRVEINGITKVMLTDNRLPLSNFGVSGKTKVKLTLINNLRNLLGPHHLTEGECYIVGPWRFFKEPCIWNPNEDGSAWSDDYCFVEMGI
ncbi:MAG: hypothetical protein J6C82_01350 [Clostridia bacterium]|nr:hypothetical protein [Clostridia bacterium]